MLSIEQVWGSRPWLSVLNILDLRYVLANQVKILSEQLIFDYELEKVISAADINMDVILKFTYFLSSISKYWNHSYVD